MKEKQEIISNHPYSIWEGTDGLWHTYIPDKKKKNGRTHRKRKTKKDIEDFVVEYWKKVKDEENDENEHTFKNRFWGWVELQKSYGVSINTVKKYECDYGRFFRDTDFELKDVRSTNEEDIKSFIIQRIKKLSLLEKAAKSLIGYVKSVFKSARINKIITDNPCDYIENRMLMKHCAIKIRTTEQRTISDDDLSLLYKQIQLDHVNKPNYIPSYAVELAILTGMRSGELSGLRWNRIVKKEHIIIVDTSEKYNQITHEYFIDSTKTKKIRHVPMSKETEELLERIRKVQMQYGYSSEFVFANENGRVHGRVISDCIRNKCIQVGIDYKGIHAVRRTLNSKLKCMGVSTTIAASMLGHTPEVNENNYTYDISGNEYKHDIFSKLNEKTSKLANI